jgi:UDP-glucose 4-epimerase
MPRSVFITGARGYVGGRLTKGLSETGWRVIGSTRRLGASPPGWPSEADLIELDPLDSPDTLARLLGGADVVVHLAAANELRSATDPDASLTETASGTRHVLEASIRAGVSRFIFFSTIHVYGAPLSGGISEDRIPRPSHPYAISHMAGEAFVLAARDAGRIDGIVVRLSNAIGAPAWFEIDRWALLGNDLARQAMTDGQIVLRTPYQWRDFIAMEDVCRGVDILCQAGRGSAPGIVNLGSGRAVQVHQIAARIARLAERRLGRAVTIEPFIEGRAEPAPFQLSIDRMRELGFAPSEDNELDIELDQTLALLSRN